MWLILLGWKFPWDKKGVKLFWLVELLRARELEFLTVFALVIQLNSDEKMGICFESDFEKATTETTDHMRSNLGV